MRWVSKSTCHTSNTLGGVGYIVDNWSGGAGRGDSKDTDSIGVLMDFPHKGDNGRVNGKLLLSWTNAGGCIKICA